MTRGRPRTRDPRAHASPMYLQAPPGLYLRIRAVQAAHPCVTLSDILRALVSLGLESSQIAPSGVRDHLGRY